MITAILTILLPVSGIIQAAEGFGNENRTSSVVQSQIVHGWQPGNGILSALLQVGFENHLPMGILVQGDILCEPKSTAGQQIVTLEDLSKQIGILVPGYKAEIKDGVFFVHPQTVSPFTLNLLKLIIPRFRSGQGGAEKFGVDLWMHIRAVLVPSEGSAFIGGVQRGTENLPDVEMTNVTVEQILDRIVTLKTGGMWIMYEVPPDWNKDPKSMPFEILSYSGMKEAISCTEPTRGP